MTESFEDAVARFFRDPIFRLKAGLVVVIILGGFLVVTGDVVFGAFVVCLALLLSVFGKKVLRSNVGERHV